MLHLKARLNKLENVLIPAKGLRPGVRVLVCGMTRPADMTQSTCLRTMTTGVLTEVVNLDVDRDELSDEQLEQFIASFPIRAAA